MVYKTLMLLFKYPTPLISLSETHKKVLEDQALVIRLCQMDLLELRRNPPGVNFIKVLLTAFATIDLRRSLLA